MELCIFVLKVYIFIFYSKQYYFLSQLSFQDPENTIKGQTNIINH